MVLYCITYDIIFSYIYIYTYKCDFCLYWPKENLVYKGSNIEGEKVCQNILTKTAVIANYTATKK